jgi:DNA-binding response OmpR family regulator
MKVLLIEPDTKLAKTYIKALQSAGHTAMWAATAQAAVHASDTLKPELVILELQLSSHNGIEFVYEFRSYPEWQYIPIILLTMVPPHSLQITSEMMEDLSIVRCLYKPATSLKQLVTSVAEQS